MFHVVRHFVRLMFHVVRHYVRWMVYDVVTLRSNHSTFQRALLLLTQRIQRALLHLTQRFKRRLRPTAQLRLGLSCG